MAAPVKAFIQPTAATHGRTFMRLPVDFVKLLSPGGHAWPYPMFHMAYDPLANKFALASYYTAAPPNVGTSRTPPTRFVKGPTLSASYMVANTFPAAYAVTQLRPSFGQLWPRSGAIPY